MIDKNTKTIAKLSNATIKFNKPSIMITLDLRDMTFAILQSDQVPGNTTDHVYEHVARQYETMLYQHPIYQDDISDALSRSTNEPISGSVRYTFSFSNNAMYPAPKVHNPKVQTSNTICTKIMNRFVSRCGMK